MSFTAKIDDMISVLELCLDDIETHRDDVDVASWQRELNQNYRLRDLLWGYAMGQTSPPVFPRILMVLRQCLLAHRWTEAAHLLHVLALTRLGASSFFKTLNTVGLDLLYGNDELISQITKLFKEMPGIPMKLVNLQEALWKLSEGNVEEARVSLKFNPPKRGFIKKCPNHVALLCRCYEGMILYTMWLGKRADQDTLQHVQDEGTVGDATARNILELWKGLEAEEGVWDIFVTKHVEVLEYYGMEEQAVGVLKTYADKHPDNPNALRYLYQFYSRHKFPIGTCIEALQDYCDAVPCDELTLELHKMLKTSKVIPKKRLYLLFDLLDYQCWQHNLKAWQSLAEELNVTDVSSKEKQVLRKAVKKCWKIRDSWWPQYHFRQDQVSTDKPVRDASVAEPSELEWNEEHDNRLELVVYKATVATCLLGPDNVYSKGALQLEEMTEEQTAYLNGATCILEPT